MDEVGTAPRPEQYLTVRVRSLLVLNTSVVSVFHKTSQNAIVLSDVSTLALSLSLGLLPHFFSLLLFCVSCVRVCVCVRFGNPSSLYTCIPPSPTRHPIGKAILDYPVLLQANKKYSPCSNYEIIITVSPGE